MTEQEISNYIKNAIETASKLIYGDKSIKLTENEIKLLSKSMVECWERRKFMFKIDNIKAGYLLEMDNGKYYIVNYNNRNILGIGNGISDKKDISQKETYCDIMNFDDDLYCDWRKIRINKIYSRTFNGELDLNLPKGRELLWSRFKEYKIGDKFIINRISVQKINGDSIKKIYYENIEATIIDFYSNQYVELYYLSFDNNTIIVIEDYLKNLKRV